MTSQALNSDKESISVISQTFREDIPLHRQHFGMATMNTYMIGTSEIMQKLRDTIARVAPTSLPVLIEGPTGRARNW
jgi:transcriptional regulator with AAA-type ATPase domain